MDIGEKFKAVRKRKTLTLQAVAEALGLSSTGHLSQIERGKKEPSALLINNFRSTFSVSENWWETGEGDMFNGEGPEGNYGEAEPGHRDAVTEKEAEWLRSTIPPSGNLSKREEQMVKMFRYLTEHNSQLAQTVWEDMVEAFLDAHGDGATPGK